jgi:uncharacterized paraquat-inducible protein A
MITITFSVLFLYVILVVSVVTAYRTDPPDRDIECPRCGIQMYVVVHETHEYEAICPACNTAVTGSSVDSIRLWLQRRAAAARARRAEERKGYNDENR